MVSTKTVLHKQKLNVILHTAKNWMINNENIVLGFAIVAILATQVAVLSRGFVSVSFDEYSRVLLAASWAESPYFIERYILDIVNVWQPWHFYLLGVALKVHNSDLFLTSRIVTMMFSLISLGMLYLLVRKLFDRWVALLSVLIVGLLPPHIYLSLTPMADIVFITFTIGFLYYFFVWLDSHIDRHLLLSAFILGLASGFRYDGWFTVVIFSAYLGLRWLVGLWTMRSLHLLWLLAIGLACLPACIWLFGNYIYWGDLFHFLAGHKGSGIRIGEVGPLTTLSPKLAYVEVLLQNGAFICSLAIGGIVLSHRLLSYKLWLYLTFSLVPLVVLISRGSIGTAYRPHYPFPYLVLVTPFCAYALCWAIVPKQSSHHRWQMAGWGMLALMSLYNLWVVYLRFTERHSWVVICLMALAGIALSYWFLNHRHWLYFVLSLSPLPVLMLISRSGLAPSSSRLYCGLYFFLLILFYAYLIWRSAGGFSAPSRCQRQIAGLGMLIIVCLFNLQESMVRIPEGMPTDVIQSGLAVRQLFEEGALADDDKVLVEVEDGNYSGMQVMSNHPGNFILDRSAYGESDRESFLLDVTSSPYEIGTFFSSYEERDNPFSLNPPLSLDDYLKDRRIRLVIIKDPRLETLLVQQTSFERIEQVDDYLFYFAKNK